jgi:hypothetical protein
LALSFLGRGDIDSYLSLAFPGHKLPAHFGDVIYARTEGSPLFMADLLTYLRDRGVIAQSREGWSLAGASRCDSYGIGPRDDSAEAGAAEQRIVNSRRGQRAGTQFDSAAVAGGVALAPADVEERLQSPTACTVDSLAARQDCRMAPTVLYGFVHVLYQHAFDELSPNRRAAAAGVIALHSESPQTGRLGRRRLLLV